MPPADCTGPAGSVAFRCQTLDPVLDRGDECLLIRHCRDPTLPSGGLLVQCVPAAEEQLGIQESIEVLKSRVLAGVRLLGYAPQREVVPRCSSPTVSGAGCFCGRRSSVKSFPLWQACPTSEDYV